jgi:DNA-binding transcriptional MerR regulator/effector-binding domain-containing protein
VFSIGEFSMMTGLTVKTLRFYHDKGILIPFLVDPQTGYRHYEARQIEKARVVTLLRGLEFSLEQIGELLSNYDDEADILDFLERHRAILKEKVRRYRGMVDSLEEIIHKEREARMAVQNGTFAVTEKMLEPQLIAGVRMKGRYSECGKGFAQIGRALGRYISGKCFLLHYDTEYREEDAQFEACMPVRQAKDADGISVRELSGGRCVSLLHQGPYEKLGQSYAKILAHIKEKRYKTLLPTREVYLKGPGMIFRGNPKKYLTEIQFLIEERKEP